MDYVTIQVQDYGGLWIAISNLVNNLQRVGFEMRSVNRDIEIAALER